MAKQEILDYDFEEFFNETFERTSVLMFSTHHQAFTFAFYINQLYNMRLERRDDIVIHRKKGDVKYSVFYYQDNISHMVYFLVDSSSSMLAAPSTSTIFDKTMLIIGPDAYAKAQFIYDDLNQSNINSESFVGQQRDELRNSFVNTGILESALFDFSDPEKPRTTYFTNSSSPEIEKKRMRFLNEQREFVTDLFIALDDMMPDFELQNDE